jgi:hypothetical protein
LNFHGCNQEIGSAKLQSGLKHAYYHMAGRCAKSMHFNGIFAQDFSSSNKRYSKMDDAAGLPAG